jgi:hypothetical protein
MRAGVAGIQHWGAERRSCRTTLGVRAEAMGHAGRAVLTDGQAIQPRSGGAPRGGRPSGQYRMRLRVSDLEMALGAISIQNRAEVRKWAVGRGPEGARRQRSARIVSLAEGVQ